MYDHGTLTILLVPDTINYSGHWILIFIGKVCALFAHIALGARQVVCIIVSSSNASKNTDLALLSHWYSTVVEVDWIYTLQSDYLTCLYM